MIREQRKQVALKKAHRKDSDQKTDTTRKALLEAGKVLFARNGFDGTSVREIADEACANISLVSYYFKGKEGLFRACVEQFGQDRLRVAQNLLQPAKNIEEFKIRLEMFALEILECHVAEPELTKIIHHEMDNESTLVNEVFKGTFLKVFETLVKFFESGQKLGIVRKELDPLVVVSLFFGGLLHLARNDRSNRRHLKRTLAHEGHRKLTAHTSVELIIKGCMF